jgi:transcription antitermination factor NusG
MEKWIAVYTKSRHEKVVIQELENKNIEAYCPIFKERRQWSDRKRWVEFPLFRSYVFAKIELKNSLYVLQAMGVHHIIKFQGNISIIPDEIIQNIKSMIDGGFTVEQVEYFVKGDEVIVVDGPLKGMDGIVVKIKNENKLVLKVAAIQQAIAVQIHPGYLKPKKKHVNPILQHNKP